MKIEVSAHFANASLSLVVNRLCVLKGGLTPTHFGLDEDRNGMEHSISDTQALHDLLARKLPSFILFADHSAYFFRSTGPGDFVVEAFMDGEQEAETVLRQLLCEPVEYAHACAPEERSHRNRLRKSTAYGQHEAWVGRDWNRYVPGLYWLTALPARLVARTGLPLDRVTALGLEAEEVQPGLVLVRLYRAACDWPAMAPAIDRFCLETQGMFSIDQIRARFEAADTFLESSAVLREAP